MSHADRLVGLIIEAQKDIFRIAKLEHGFTYDTLEARTGIPKANIKYYAGGHGAMPISAMLRLVGVIPDALLSRLLAPVDRCVTPCATTGDDDFDALATESGEYLGAYAQARHPDGPGGVAIIQSEASVLQFKRPRGKAA